MSPVEIFAVGKPINKIIFCEELLMMLESSLVGKNPPVELIVIAKLNPLNSLTPEKVNKIKINAVKNR